MNRPSQQETGETCGRGVPVLLAGLMLLVGCAAMPISSAEPFEAAWAAVTDRFDEDLTGNRYVGGSLYFVHDGKTIGAHHFGQRTLEPRRPVAADTIYHWASITKTFTAIGIMQLRDRGLLSLDDPVTKYVPVLREAHNPYGSMDDIRIRHLLTHTSGLRGSTFPWGGSEDWHEHEPKEWSQWDAMLPYTQLHFEPGTSYSYSNPGTSLLGRIIEAITNDDIEEYVDKNILRPLGMYDSYFDVTPWHLKSRRSDNFWVDGEEIEANGIDFDTGMTAGNGGLNGPVADMVKYVNFLLGVGDGGHEVLDRGSLEQMWIPHHVHEEFPRLTESMATTFFVIDYRPAAGEQTRYIGHTGGQLAFQSFIYLQPGSGTAAIMAVNARTTSMERDLYNDTRQHLFERVFPLFQAR